MTRNLFLTTFATDLTPANYINLVAFVILYYDYALTFVDEVDRFWASRSISWASLLFYLNRYLSLLGHIIIMIEYFWDPTLQNASICSSLSSFHQYYAVIVQIIVGFLLILRTYALYDRSWRALLFMLVVAGGVIVLGTWTVVKGVHGPEPNSNWTGVGCVPSLNKAPAIRYAAAWSGALVFDIVIFTMTIYKSVRRSRVGNRSLTHILLRDGAIYFGIMAAVTLSNILSFLLSADADRGFMTTFANIMSSTMLSRLMLNLRDPRLSRTRGGTSEESTRVGLNTTKPVFSTLLVNTTHTSESQLTTPEYRRSTIGSGDPDIELTTISAVSIPNDHHV